MNKKNLLFVPILFSFVFLFVRCESDSYYTIGGTVSGLNGTLVLQNNGSDDLTITKNGKFTFDITVVEWRPYQVTVLTQPDGQICTATKNSGSVHEKNITTVVITCSGEAEGHTIGGTVTGLTGTLVLQNNADDDKTITSNGAFTFATPVANDAAYDVTVLNQPATRYCVVANGSGTATGDVTNVTVTCRAKKLAFVSAGARNGDLDSGSGAAAGADAVCMGDGNYPGSGTYKAMIATSTRHACTTANCGGGAVENLDWVLAANNAITRVDGTTLIGITNAAGIWSFDLENTYDLPVDANEAARVWTGLADDWTTDNNCSDWSVADVTQGNHGRRDAVTIQAIHYSNQNCSDLNALLCVQQ